MTLKTRIRQTVLLTSLFATAAVLVIVATAYARSQAADKSLDAVKVAPDSHKIALENPFVRILDVHVGPGKIEPRHAHPHGLSVYFTDWDAKVTVDGKAAEVHHRKAGTFAWSEAVIHTVENVGKTEGHILRIELKQ
jgi:quercetin dioxygenase-like cupin family protein